MSEKYPRTFHLPWSPGATSDDKIMRDTGLLNTRELVATEKMDGGNFTMTRERAYSRSPEAVSQPWDDRARGEWARVRHEIPEGFRVVGESVDARRSVAYEGLAGPFLVFAVFDAEGTLLPWDDVVEWAELLGLPTVPYLWRGVGFDGVDLAWIRRRSSESSEGYVVRFAGGIRPRTFPDLVGKYVRANHVQTSDDWRHRDDFSRNGYKTA